MRVDLKDLIYEELISEIGFLALARWCHFKLTMEACVNDDFKQTAVIASRKLLYFLVPSYETKAVLRPT